MDLTNKPRVDQLIKSFKEIQKEKSDLEHKLSEKCQYKKLLQAKLEEAQLQYRQQNELRAKLNDTKRIAQQKVTHTQAKSKQLCSSLALVSTKKCTCSLNL